MKAKKRIPELSEKDKARFWIKVNRDGPIVREELGKCWLWTRCKNADGYGMFGLTRSSAFICTRIAWADTFGDPGEMCVCHKCDNPPCCNPAHLFLGTNSDNCADKVRKKRHNTPLRISRMPKGEAHCRATLTSEIVREIRILSKTTATLAISRIFGVSEGAVYKVINGITWKHV